MMFSYFKCRWFPRPRGDGPTQAERQRTRRKVPPPTRGWSRAAVLKDEKAGGSPAHAGMVPPQAASAARSARFPRPRGDGPPFIFSNMPSNMVPPPTRGWSPLFQFIGVAYTGSPAHAGMVPYLQLAPGTLYRFPRPRGDGPGICSVRNWRNEVPPPTRGWSPRATAADAIGVGSPAHAGMVPHQALEVIPGRRFPRPRGDGPRPHRPEAAKTKGSPAHAGMVPPHKGPARPPPRFPRPRGDGPTFIGVGAGNT